MTDNTATDVMVVNLYYYRNLLKNFNSRRRDGGVGFVQLKICSFFIVAGAKHCSMCDKPICHGLDGCSFKNSTSQKRICSVCMKSWLQRKAMRETKRDAWVLPLINYLKHNVKVIDIAKQQSSKKRKK